ncbi:hypothetical protein [Parasedimentitalea psychrophila]|uniref:Uncharacterized protein n=1 Tax=Parasedimentitalea psychrophila TaxID=2997337 RepID=A0A9Y2KWL7_9RHOB|nr:hypothetical protein [Parasedimentitalea psychrophila]WIY23361.1 hypothetical protein QPJ95_11860 [Parasedimentitalea psychrophila]
MAETKGFPWVRAIAIAAIIALFVADYAFNILAKPPPWWAYLVPGLLALGIEGPAVGRLLMQVVRGTARISQEEDSEK